MLTRVAIVGSSGFDPRDKKMLRKKHMVWMIEKVWAYIENTLKLSPEKVILVGGGSAWADHIVVRIFLQKNFAGLELYLPCAYNLHKNRFTNTHEGRILNMLHTWCLIKTGYDVFGELTRAHSNKSTKVTIKRGFKQRNTLIARNCDYLITFTFDEKIPSRKWASDVWNKVRHNNKIHFNLSQLDDSH
ncbi:MAG: hypothetical protein QW303_01470 [Nitrososphaerota archaeon]